MKQADRIQFGFCVPIFANPGMPFFRTPCYERLDWDSLKETVLLCEQLGYDSLFVADHVFLGREGEIWECLALMSAFAALTERMQIAPIHLCNNFRTPSITAKALATIDHISKGRLILFYDYGWRKAEFDAYGIEFGGDDERIERMGEGLAIIQEMLKNGTADFEGKHYRVDNAICTPRPPSPPAVWMGEANHPTMVKLIVAHADVFNSMPCSAAGFEQKLNVLREECAVQGRDFSELGLSLETQVLVRESDAEVDGVFASFSELRERNDSHDQDILEQLRATNPALGSYHAKEDFEDEFMIGTPAAIRGKLDRFVELGVDHFMLWFMDFPDTRGIRLFAEEVAPHYR